MTDLNKLERIIQARTPGPLKAEKYPFSGGWAIYALNEPMEFRFDLLEDTSEGDAKFWAAMGTCADEMLEVIMSANQMRGCGPALKHHRFDDAMGALLAKIAEIS